MRLHPRKRVGVLLLLLLFAGCDRGRSTERSSSNSTPGSALNVFLLRHAEANKNVQQDETFTGDPEALTARGREQARAAGRFLKDEDILGVFTSPRPSTRGTAEAIAETLGLKNALFQKEDLLPLKEGKEPDGKQTTWSWREQQWESGHDPRPQGGESLQDGMDRASRAVEALAEVYAGKSVIIVTHSDICAALIGKAEQTPISECYRKHKVPLGSISKISVSDQTWSLEGQGTIPEGTDSP